MKWLVASVAIVLVSTVHRPALSSTAMWTGKQPGHGRRRYRQYDRRPGRLHHRRWPRPTPRHWHRGAAWRPDRRNLVAVPARQPTAAIPVVQQLDDQRNQTLDAAVSGRDTHAPESHAGSPPARALSMP